MAPDSPSYYDNDELCAKEQRQQVHEPALSHSCCHTILCSIHA